MSKSLAVSLVALATVGILATTSSVGYAQTASTQRNADTQTAAKQKPRWELLIPSGTVVPTATKGNAIKRANLVAVQLSYVVRPNLAITSTVGWARSRDLRSADAPKLDVFTYDLGAELRGPQSSAGKRLTFSPFAGAGVGARSYNYRSLPVDATHNLGAYMGVGGEVGVRRVRVRLEVRDYVTGFKPLDGGGPTRARNDVVVMAGLRFTRR